MFCILATNIYFYTDDVPFPTSHELAGNFVGFAEHQGDALTYLIWTQSTQQLITRSVLRPTDTTLDPNRRLPPPRGEILHSYAEAVDVMERQLPTVNPIDIVGETFIVHDKDDDLHYRAEVTSRIENNNISNEQYIVTLGEGAQTEVMTYDAIISHINNQDL